MTKSWVLSVVNRKPVINRLKEGWTSVRTEGQNVSVHTRPVTSRRGTKLNILRLTDFLKWHVRIWQAWTLQQVVPKLNGKCLLLFHRRKKKEVNQRIWIHWNKTTPPPGSTESTTHLSVWKPADCTVNEQIDVRIRTVTALDPLFNTSRYSRFCGCLEKISIRPLTQCHRLHCVRVRSHTLKLPDLLKQSGISWHS